MTLLLFIICMVPSEPKLELDPQIAKAMEILTQQGPKQALAFTRDNELHPYTFGIKITEANATSGLLWFKKLYEITPDANFKYGIAGAHYKLGNTFSARTALIEMLADEISPVQRARVHYLNGLILYRSRQIPEAEAEFLASKSMYSSLSQMYKGVYNCLNMLAFTQLAKNDLKSADEYIAQAKEVSFKAIEAKQNPNLGTLKELSATRELLQGLEKSEKEESLIAGRAFFEGSLILYNEALTSYNSFGAAEKAQAVQIRIAILKLMIGEYSEGYALATPLSSSENPMIRAWAAIFFMKFAECGKDLNESRKWKNVAVKWMVLEGQEAAVEMLNMMLFLDKCGCANRKSKGM